MGSLTLATKAVMDVTDLFDSEDENRRLMALFEPRYTALLASLHHLTAEMLRLDPESFRLDDAAVRRILAEAGQRVVRITETTRKALAELLQQGQQMGLSDWSLANGSAQDGFPGIEGLFKERWANRALVIAQTEMAHAQVVAAADRFRASGVVDWVRLHDGDQDEPCASRNGTVVPITQVPGLAHPSCTLALEPILREGA